MRNVLQIALRLLIFSVAAALLLAGAYLITKGPIEEHALLASQGAQRAALPEAETFEAVDVSSAVPDAAALYPLVEALYAGKAGDGSIVGYVLSAAPAGYGGPIPITLGVGVDGSLHGIAVGELKETANIGMKVGEPPFLSQYEALPADPAVIDAEVDTIGGATTSSRPFKEATRQMAALVKDALGIAPHPGEPKPQPLDGDDLLRQAQLPAALSFHEVSPYALIGDYGAIQRIHRGLSGKETVGYAFELRAKGFAEGLALRASIDAAQGILTAVEVTAHNEQPLPGTQKAPIDTEAGADFLARFAGKPLTGLADIDAIGGATLTSQGILQAVGQAAAFYGQYLIPTPDPDAGIAFEDIALPAPEDYKAVQSAQRGVRDGATALYRFLVRVTGYHEESPILVRIDVDAAGDFLALTPIEQHETAGVGAEVFGNAGFLAQFLAKPATLETADEVQAVSGATVTSQALQRALKQAARAYASIAAAPADAAGDAVTVSAPAAQYPTTPGAFAGARFEPVPFADENKQFPTVKTIEKALREGEDAPLGYRIVTVSTGYNDKEKITLQFEIDAAGNFADVAVLSQAESAGLGADLLEDPAWIGKPVGQSANPDADGLIDAKAGATLTADAVRKAAKHAAAAYQAVKEEP